VDHHFTRALSWTQLFQQTVEQVEAVAVAAAAVARNAALAVELEVGDGDVVELDAKLKTLARNEKWPLSV
jgi:hypothetical protein